MKWNKLTPFAKIFILVIIISGAIAGLHFGGVLSDLAPGPEDKVVLSSGEVKINDDVPIVVGLSAQGKGMQNPDGDVVGIKVELN